MKPWILGIRWLLVLAAVEWGLASAAELTESTSTLFSGSANCAQCHDPVADSSEPSKVSIVGEWRATMMSHSFKDPLWRAVVEVEIEEHPELKGYIENKCLTCHAPMARTQSREDGLKELSLAQGV